MSFLPCFVVIRITPKAVRAPYIAAEAASFKIDTDSISCGSIMLISIGTLFTNTRGSPPLMEVVPRILYVMSSPGVPVVDSIFSPGTTPCRAAETLVIGRSPNDSLIFTEATAPVIFTFFCVPNPMTTTSSIVWVSSCSCMLKSVLFLTVTSCVT